MVTLEKIVNGYIAIFKNTENKRLKLYFQSIDEYSAWLKTQFEPKKEEK